MQNRRVVLLSLWLATALVWGGGVLELVSQSKYWPWRSMRPLAPLETVRHIIVALIVSLGFFVVFSSLAWAAIKLQKRRFNSTAVLLCGIAALNCGAVLVLWLMPRLA